MLLPQILTLWPAYGRIYSGPTHMQADWEGGKDFKIAHGPYCSIRDAEAMKAAGVVRVVIRSFDNKFFCTIPL